MKTLIFGEQDSLPLVLRSLLKLRHGQIHFRGEWNGTIGEISDLDATIHIHNKALIDLRLEKNDPYLKVTEHKLQLLRTKSAIDSSELDLPTFKKYFGKLETLNMYFEQNCMEANNE